MDEARAARALAQVRALLDRPDLPGRQRALGQRVLDRLCRPVQVVVVGQGTPLQRAVTEGFVGAALLPDGGDLPPIRISFGPTRGLTATFASGAMRPLDAAGLADLDPFALALLEVTAPVPILEKITLLHVALEGAAEDRQRAVDWAAGQADILVWTAEPGAAAADAAHWSALPESARDHAFLACADATETLPEAVGAAFRRCCRIAPPDGAARLRAEVLAHVSAARREDLDRALLLLEGHGAPDGPGAPQTAGPPAQPRAMPAAAARDDPPALAADIVRLLAARAEAVDAAAEARALVHACSEALEDCAALACGTPAEDVVGEALDLVLLLGLEGTEGAATDAVALLAQVRRECEALAA